MKSKLWRSALVILAISVAHVREAAAADRFAPKDRLAAEDRYELLRRLDANRDGRLSEQEFVGEKGGKSRTKLRKEFRRLDEDGDNRLSLKELKKKKM